MIQHPEVFGFLQDAPSPFLNYNEPGSQTRLFSDQWWVGAVKEKTNYRLCAENFALSHFECLGVFQKEDCRTVLL